MLLVTGGWTTTTLKSAELLDTNGSYLCTLPDIPGGRHYHTQNGLVSCGGGWTAGTCSTFSNGTWVTTHSIGTRIFHSSWTSPQGVLLMGGSGSSRTTTDLLTENGGTTPGFGLNYKTIIQFTAFHHNKFVR